MAKARQVLSFCDMGKAYKVIKKLDLDDETPYKIYHIYNDYGRDGYITEHRKLVAQFTTLNSCFYWFYQNRIGW